MFLLLCILFAAAIAAHAAVSAAVLWHLARYTLPGWNAVRVAVPLYIGLSLLFLALALSAFVRIPTVAQSFGLRL